MAGITLTGDGMSIPIPGTGATLTYDTARRMLTITGLTFEDLIVTNQNHIDETQAVRVEFR